jgi:SAM-dependent methyltransferase
MPDPIDLGGSPVPRRPDRAGGDRWEEHAAWWIDEFTEGADPEYEEQILPLAIEHLAGATRVLDLGCGEGQVSRRAAAAGTDFVVGLDPTWNQISVAGQRGGGPTYLRAEAAGLPFRDESFDAVIVCLVFEHVRDVDNAFAEVARVLEPGGRFVFMVNHPLFQTPCSGWIDDQVVDPPEQYWRVGPYLDEVETVEEVEKDVFIHFVHRPLSRYVNALAASGLTLEHMVEPAPPPGLLRLAPEYPDAASIPRLLLLRLRKHA